MRFVILGPGALGSVLGAALFHSGHEVVLLGRRSPHLDALRDEGLRIANRGGGRQRLRIEATDDPAAAARAETIVVMVKSGDTTDAMTVIAPHVGLDQTVLTLQNGLGNAERIRQILGSRPRVLPGTTSQAATRSGPGEVVHTGEGPTLIGFTDQDDAPVADPGVERRHFDRRELPAVATSQMKTWPTRSPVASFVPSLEKAQQ